MGEINTIQSSQEFTWKAHGDTARVTPLLLFCGLWLGRRQWSGCRRCCTSRPWEVRSLDSLQLSPQETYGRGFTFPLETCWSISIPFNLCLRVKAATCCSPSPPGSTGVKAACTVPGLQTPHLQGSRCPRNCTDPGERPASGSWLRHRKSSCQEDSSVLAHPCPPAPFSGARLLFRQR